jgi:high-affinity nickel permease
MEILTQMVDLSPVLIMGLGLAIGLEHAFDPDHVAEIGTQVSKDRFAQKSTKQLIKNGAIGSSALGVFWGPVTLLHLS